MTSAARAPFRARGETLAGLSKTRQSETTPNRKPVIFPEYCHDLSPTISKWCPLRAVSIHSLSDVGMFVDDMRLYHYDNHPVKWVKIVGVVVAVDEWAGRTYATNTKSNGASTMVTSNGKMVYTVDDGSGWTIECCCVDARSATSKNDTSGTIKFDDTRGRNGREITRQKSQEIPKESKAQEGVQNPNVPWDQVDVGTVIKVKGRVGAFREVMQVEVVRVEVVKGLDSEVKFWDEAVAFKRDILQHKWALSDQEVEALKKKREKSLKRERKRKVIESEKSRNRSYDMAQHESNNMRMKNGSNDRLILSKVVGAESKTGALDEEKRQKRIGHERGAKERHDEKVRKRREDEAKRHGGKHKLNPIALAAVRRAAAGKYDALGI